MTNFIQKSGLDFSLGKNKLSYSQAAHPTGDDWEKTFEAGKYAYKNPTGGPPVLYYGIRYMEADHNEPTFIDADLMADLTVINPGFVGDEYVKTVGHYHGHSEESGVAYPEVYENISGGFEYLLQSEPDADGFVNVIWVLTEPGDKVVMPPGWGHVSMNVSGLPAVELDLQKRDNPNQSDYSLLQQKVGGAFYRTKEGIIKNPYYQIGYWRVVRPKEKPDWCLKKSIPLYKSFVQNPEAFRFLTHPEEFEFDLRELFEDIKPLPFKVQE